MHDQLSRALLFQSTLPPFVSVGPILVVCIPSFFYASTGRTAMYSMLIASWVPSFNPLLTMLAITPYRQALTRWLSAKTAPSLSTETLIDNVTRSVI
ncbi:unnamed protein product [Bursaphelenchus okinawaensis]|uniref:G protein-coupled receptor n=1 Tax=Bursaphelenchus okinawaensis TaxID=465554 RepID=A0A811K5Q5_9BILA|nr:unnamed protein product [Bursaphelenchus okinawaensis]CAG9091307.1 unnamed protein product [Bursaphelenchus okinawaensis]